MEDGTLTLVTRTALVRVSRVDASDFTEPKQTGQLRRLPKLEVPSGIAFALCVPRQCALEGSDASR
jgi:hypothetical protein